MRRISARDVDPETPQSGSNNTVTIPVRSKRSLAIRIANSPWTVASLIAVAVASLIVVLTLNSRNRQTVIQTVPPSQQPVSAPETPLMVDPVEESPIQAPLETVVPDVPHSTVEEEMFEPVSALEPFNSDSPLTWPAASSRESSAANEPPAETIKIDVEGKMAQRLVSYKQPRVSRRKLIDALQEQLGASIRYDVDELGAKELEEPISFELQNTTIGEVIQLVAKKSNWQIVVEPTGIRLLRSQLKPDP